MPGMPGFMPMVAPGVPAGFVPGMGMGGVPANPMRPGMVGVPGMMPAPPMMPGMQGMMNGMQNLGLNAPAPQANPAAVPGTANMPNMSSPPVGMMPTPPPPPPLGMPAGPPPGPPPEPPQN